MSSSLKVLQCIDSCSASRTVILLTHRVGGCRITTSHEPCAQTYVARGRPTLSDREHHWITSETHCHAAWSMASAGYHTQPCEAIGQMTPKTDSETRNEFGPRQNKPKPPEEDKAKEATRWLSWYGVGLASADRLPVVVRIPAGPLGSLKCDPPKGNGRRPQKKEEDKGKGAKIRALGGAKRAVLSHLSENCWLLATPTMTTINRSIHRKQKALAILSKFQTSRA